MSKKNPKTTKHVKDKRVFAEAAQVQDDKPAEPEQEVIVGELGPIRITLDSYQNVVGLFKISNIKTECSFLGKTIGETGWITVTDDEYLPIDKTLSIDVDIKSVKDLNKLISSPVLGEVKILDKTKYIIISKQVIDKELQKYRVSTLLRRWRYMQINYQNVQRNGSTLYVTVYQVMETFDPMLQDQLQTFESSAITTEVARVPRDSIISIYEPIADQTLEFAEQNPQKQKTKGKGNKSPKSTKGKASRSELSAAKPAKNKRSKTKSSKTKSASSISGTSSDLRSQSAGDIQKEPLIFGMCTIDLLPLLYGEKAFSETILIKPSREHNVEQMKAYEANPKISVTVSVEEDINIDGATILSCTIESVYNIPLLMKPEMQYTMCGLIPVDDTENCSMLFSNPRFTTRTNQGSNILYWPGMQKIGLYANTTKYRMSTDDDAILCKLEDDIMPFLKQENPRLEFNMIRRNFLLRDGTNNLAAHIKTYRNLVLEFYMTTKSLKKSPRTANKGSKKFSSPSSESSSEKSYGTFKKPAHQPFLHLMAVLDVSSFLYPGVSRVRLASPLTTFSKEEALKYGGLKESFFDPSVIAKVESKTPRKKVKGDKKHKEAKGKKSATSSRTSKKEIIKESPDQNPVENLPEPEPSLPVYDENGKPCFIIVEIELSKPIISEHDEEDQRERLNQLLKTTKCPSIEITHLKEDRYKNVMNDIINDINNRFQIFLEENPARKDMRTLQTIVEFLKFLQSTGPYRDYLTSLSEAAAPLVRNRMKLGAFSEKNCKTHQNFISEEFVYFVSEMNEMLNKLVCYGMDPAREESVSNNKLFFSKEALEMKDTALANRYLVERISVDAQNPNHWFDYAVYFLGTNDNAKAYACLKAALLINPNHRYSLMIFGILLDNKNLTEEAEACFLNLTVQAPRWVEAWAVLYLFYKKYGNYEGMDITMGMAKKYMDDERDPVDYFTYFEDLAWTYKTCPRTLFFRTAMILLKMRLYDWAETAASEEVHNHFGLVNYLLAAIRYYKGLYSDALECVDKAKADCGLNYAIAALSGHCLFALNEMAKAKQEYYRALGYINRPDNIHLVYLNCADILEKSGEYEESKKLLLLANKYSPTPTTWLRAGLLYLKENDLLAAEKCFSEGNLIDHRRGELWGNLFLVNLKLNRPHEAELCYHQAMNNKLKDTDLQDIEKEFKKLKK